MNEIVISESDIIKGVKYVQLASSIEGNFTEDELKELFPEVNWGQTQSEEIGLKKDELRGLYCYHRQTRYLYLVSGEILVGLCDLRQHFPTFQDQGIRKTMATMLGMKGVDRIALLIHPRIAYGFLARKEAKLISIASQDDSKKLDRFGLAWDDPVLGLNWGIENPILSKRDMNNPFLKDIPKEDLPG